MLHLCTIEKQKYSLYRLALHALMVFVPEYHHLFRYNDLCAAGATVKLKYRMIQLLRSTNVQKVLFQILREFMKNSFEIVTDERMCGI